METNNIKLNSNISNYFTIASIVMFSISLLLLSTVVMIGVFSPILLYFMMLVAGILLIFIISTKNEVFIKIKLFFFFFSLYLIYTLSVHYILLDDSTNILLQIFDDENTLYRFSYQGLPYVSGKKNFFDIFFIYEVNELPLHVVFRSLIAYFSISIDGTNVIITQKLLSPFFGGLFSVVLYSTLKYQFKNTVTAFNATIVYGLFSAIFMYSTPMLRDIDIALTYMLFFYLFLQKGSFINVLSMLLVAFMTYFLRNESGLVLFSLTILSLYFSVKELKNKWLRMISYLVLFVLFLAFAYLSISVIVSISEHYSSMAKDRIMHGITGSSAGAFSSIFEKLPFGLSHSAKVMFGQMQPFPLFTVIDRPSEMISGIFWPFVIIMMLYGVIHKHIREKIDIKVKYLLLVAIAILFLMSAEPETRRMLSVYPIIYITAIYAFNSISKDKINRMFYSYLFGLISLNVLYYLLKIGG